MGKFVKEFAEIQNLLCSNDAECLQQIKQADGIIFYVVTDKILDIRRSAQRFGIDKIFRDIFTGSQLQLLVA